MDRLSRQYNARLLIPLHDAFIFEAPLEVLEEVAQLTKRVMCEAVQEYFSELRPQAEVNIKRPDCWNKEGDAAVLTRWLRDPLAAVKANVKKS